MSTAFGPRIALAEATEEQTYRTTVLVMCHNEVHAVRHTLAALSRQTLAERPQILLASNKPTDGTNRVLAEYPYRRLHLDDNYFISALRNAAAAVATSEILIFLDGHMVLEGDCLRYFVEAFDDERVAVAFGYYKTPDDPELPWYEYIRDARYHAKSGKAALTEPLNYGLDGFVLPTGGLFAIRRSALLECGGFDTRFRRDCFEDVLVGIRLVNAGYRIVYDPRIRAAHLHHHPDAKALLRRGRVAEPRGMVRLLSVAANEGLRVPYDGYGLALPVTPAVLLVAGAAANGPLGLLLIAAAGAAVIRDVWPIFRLDPRQYPMRLKVATAGYWYLVNFFRLGYAAWTLFRRQDTYAPYQEVAGAVASEDGESRPVVVTMPQPDGPRAPGPRYVARLLAIYVRLGVPELFAMGRWVVRVFRRTGGRRG